MPYHAIATLSGSRQKIICNKSEEQMLSQVVLPFVSGGVITAKWGKKTQSYQVLELRIFETAPSRNRSICSEITRGGTYPRWPRK